MSIVPDNGNVVRRRRLHRKYKDAGFTDAQADQILDILEDDQVDAFRQWLRLTYGQTQSEEVVAKMLQASQAASSGRTSILYGGGTTSGQKHLGTVQDLARGNNGIQEWPVFIAGLVEGDAQDPANYTLVAERFGCHSNDDALMLFNETNSCAASQAQADPAVRQLSEKTLGN